MREYVESCVACRQAKADHQNKQGLFQAMPIRKGVWEMVNLDFIGPLKRTARGYNAILVVMDRLSKQAHYIPTTTTVTAVGIARLVWDNIIKYHGIPQVIISDRDPRWTSNFWREVWSLTNTQLKMSTAYHPETDGLVERQNKTLEEMLRNYVNEKNDDWDLYLTAAEIAYNTSVQKSTGKTPFYMNNGREMFLPIDLAVKKAGVSRNLTASEFWAEWNAAIETVKLKLTKEQLNQQKYANQHRREVKYQVNDQVFVSTKDWPVFSHKLSSRYVGPFRVVKRIEEN